MVHPAARKHGIADEDIEHATNHAMAIEQQDDDSYVYIGPSHRPTAGGRRDPPRRWLGARDPRDANAAQAPATASRRMIVARKTHGTTASGVPITDKLIEKLAERAEAGYDVDEMLRRRRGPSTDRLGRRERGVGPPRPGVAKGSRCSSRA